MNKRGLGVFIGLLALIAMTVSPAVAQIQTGSVLIKVLDDQGAVVPGVTVTIASPVLPREILGVTDAGGIYQVPGLAVGTYTIKTTLQGFQTVIRQDIIVRQGQVVNVEIPMKVSSLSEEITVKGESPVVDTKTVGSRVSIDKDLLDNTPGGKDIWNILEYKAPGVVVASPDVGGNQGGLQRSMSARGTPNAQNTQMLNGVNVNDPAAQGFSMNYYIPSAFENIEVSSGAQDIAVGTGGIFINMVTKSGSNRVVGSALQTWQGNATQWDNIDDSLKQAGFRPNAQATDLLSNSNFQLGGPLLRNKLFYFGSLNFQATHVSVPGFPAVAPSYIATPLADTSDQDTTDILAGEGRVTYALNQRNRFDGYLSKQRYDKPNRGANASTTQDSNSKELDTFVVAQVAHNLVMSDRMFLDSKISFNNTHFPLSQKTGLQPLNDTSTNNTLYRNRNSTAMMFRRRLQIVSNWQYFGLNFLGGRHDFKAGFDNGFTPEDVDTTRVDEVNLNFASLPTATLPAPRATTLTVFNSPLHQERAVMSTAFYGQDSFSVGRLTVVGGIRWERVEGYLPAQVTPASRYFPEGLLFQGVTINGVVQNYTVRKSFDAVRNNPLWHNWGPRVSGTYDLTGQGRTILKASWGKYLDQINTGTPPNPNANINQQYVWNDNGDLIFQPGNATWDGLKYVGGEFGALNSTNNLAVAVFDPTVRRPYRNQTTISVDHELFPEVLLSVAYLRTREKDVQGTLDQSMDLWPVLYTPVDARDPGRDGVLNTSDDATLTVYSLNQGAVTSTKTVNDDRLAARYDGLDLIVSKRFTRGWNLLAGYTYSRTRVDLTSLSNPNNVFVNAGGESGGRRHNFKGSGSYMLPWNVLLAANFRLGSGEPTTRTWAVPTCSATVTTGCVRQNNLTVNAEPRGSVELGWLPTVDVRAGRYFDINGNRLELSVDVYNFGNLNTVWNVRNGTGLTPIRVGGDPSVATTTIATFLSPTNVLGPQVIRFNVSYRFGQR